MLLDGKYGREALFRAVDHDFWIGRPVEEPGSRPLEFEFGGSLGAKLSEWPVAHTIKCLCFYHPDDPPDLKARQERELLRLADAARTLRARIADRDHREQERARRRRHDRPRHRAALCDRRQAGLVEAGRPAKRRGLGQCRARDRSGRSLVPRDHAARARSAGGRSCRRPSRCARNCGLVKGFAVGRTIFVEPALEWFAGRIGDARRPSAWRALLRGCAISGSDAARGGG